MTTFWALSDLHLSFTANGHCTRPMHAYGKLWREHWAKIAQGWRSCVAPDDVVLVTGDISWGRQFERCLPDLDWIDSLPGRTKLIVRGNHDQWWPTTVAEWARVPTSIHLLEGTAVEVAGEVFCGTGCWVTPQDPYYEPLDRPSFERELVALEQALEAGGKLSASVPGRYCHLLTHFAPHTSAGIPNAFDRLLRKYPVASVTYGHYHDAGEWKRAPKGWVDGIYYTLASCDYCNFTPTKLPIPVPPTPVP